jgi:hypothetical protein
MEIPSYWDWLDDVSPEIRDVRRRMWWAHEDGETLHAAIAEFASTNPHQMFVQHDDDRWQVTFHRMIEEREEWETYERLARILGSYLDSNRAALNYFAVAMAKRAIAEDPSLVDQSLPYMQRLNPDWVEFPIFNKKAKFFDVGEEKIRKLPQKFRSIIQDVQPYNGGHKGLWDLQVLSAEYRHRVIHPITVIPLKEHFAVVLDGEPVDTANMTVHVGDGPIEDGDRVMDFTAGAVPGDRYEDLKPQVTISIGLDHPLCRGRDCMIVINRINKDVVEVAERIEPLFRPDL